MTLVKILGFRVGSGGYIVNNGKEVDDWIRREKDYVNSFSGKCGVIEFEDRYGLTIFFGDRAMIRRCRFAEEEVERL